MKKLKLVGINGLDILSRNDMKKLAGGSLGSGCPEDKARECESTGNHYDYFNCQCNASECLTGHECTPTPAGSPNGDCGDGGRCLRDPWNCYKCFGDEG